MVGGYPPKCSPRSTLLNLLHISRLAERDKLPTIQPVHSWISHKSLHGNIVCYPWIVVLFCLFTATCQKCLQVLCGPHCWLPESLGSEPSCTALRLFLRKLALNQNYCHGWAQLRFCTWCWWPRKRPSISLLPLWTFMTWTFTHPLSYPNLITWCFLYPVMKLRVFFFWLLMKVGVTTAEQLEVCYHSGVVAWQQSNGVGGRPSRP